MAKDYGKDAAGEKVDITRGDLVRFWPEDLIPSSNYRFGSFDTDPAVRAARDKEIEEMVVSLCQERQKQPISIHEVSGARFKVHAGDTRYQAFLRINERKIWPWGKPEDNGRARVECRVENFAKDAAKEVFGASVVENMARNSLTVIDLCFAVHQAEQLGYTDAEIVAKFRQSDPAWLPNMRRLARLPDERKREIHLKQMTPAVGYLLADIPEEAHAEVLAIATAASTPKVSTETEPPLFSESAPTAADFQAALTGKKKPTRKPKSRLAETPKRPVTARAVVTAAKKLGHLKGKKVAHTIAGMREFWEPIVDERKGSLASRLAAANLAWIDEADDEKFWNEIKSILKEVR